MSMPVERFLDGLYIRVENPETNQHESRCLSDCTKEQQIEYVSQLDKEQVTGVTLHLLDVIREIGDQLEIVRQDEPEEESPPAE